MWKKLVKKYLVDKYFWKWFFRQFKYNNYSIRTVIFMHIGTIIMGLCAYYMNTSTKTPLLGVVVYILLLCLSISNYMGTYDNYKSKNWKILKNQN